MTFETRPGGEKGTPRETAPRGKTRRDAQLEQARTEGAQVEEREGKTTIVAKPKGRP